MKYCVKIYKVADSLSLGMERLLREIEKDYPGEYRGYEVKHGPYPQPGLSKYNTPEWVNLTITILVTDFEASMKLNRDPRIQEARDWWFED